MITADTDRVTKADSEHVILYQTVAMSGPGQDRTVNRVAICSAIFAGFAYVGYSVVRQAFGRRLVGFGLFRNEGEIVESSELVSFYVLNRLGVKSIHILIPLSLN